MINSAALLPSLSRSSGLSPRSAIGLNIIRRDSIAVDRLLKERLVLSKVRYGIERQQQERERRRNREADLETDSKQNYEVDAPNDPRKRRRGMGGLLGTVFGGILSSLGGVAFQAAPAFLLARRKIIGGGTNFNRTIGATDGLLNTIKGQKGPFDTLRKVKLDPVKNIGKTVTKFGNSLTLFVNSAIAGQIGGRAIDRFRTPAQVKAQASQSLKRETTPRTPKKIRKRMKRRSDAKSFAEVQREIDLREYDSLTPKAKARIRSENISRTLREAEEVIPNRKPRVQREDFLGMNKPRKGVQVPVDLLQRQRQRATRRIVTPVGDELLRQFNAEQRAIQYGKNFDQIQVNLQDVEFVGDDVFLNRKFSKTPKPALLLETVNIDGKDFYFFNETDSRRLLDERIRKKLEIKDQRRQREITKKYQTQQQKTQQPQGKINRNNFKSAGAMGRQSYPPGFEY